MLKEWSIEETSDGSPTLISTKFNAHFHSTHGAVQESQHVYIASGLEYYASKYPGKPIHLLEYGMGTGLNVLLTLRSAINQRFKIQYHAIEAYPISPSVYQKIKYPDAEKHHSLSALHKLEWGVIHELHGDFSFIKEEITFERFSTTKKYDIVYYDAFGPGVQAHLWEEEMMRNVYGLLEPGGILVTFCAKGSFKRALKAVGFEIEGIPGPPGKREITRASKI